MISPSEILSRIDAYTLSTESQEPRDWLGASAIGEKCIRRLWYSFRFCGGERFDGRMLRLFQRGHREEMEFVGLLRGSGWQVFMPFEDYIDGMDDFRFSDLGGHFRGTCDGVAYLPGDPEPCLLSFKTWKAESKVAPANGFETLLRLGVKEAAPKHWSQEICYMGEMGIERTLYCALCKNDDRLHFEWIEFDRVHFETLLTKAEIIINSPTPPDRISNNPDAHSCKFCPYKSICHAHSLLPVSNYHCRNCRYSAPVAGGQWECQKGHTFGQVCEDYCFNG